MRTKEAKRIRSKGLKRAKRNGHVVATICESEAFSAGCEKKYFNPDRKSYLQQGGLMLATALAVFLIVLLLVMIWRKND